ncbi:hypothetical protein [Desulfoferrobacter suflitae]|uniref:hypothetical protein n=1 Tax=Desulfoferrobacter suflitae TaxID=2865782 RepID=UPI00216402F1|nr:hypothetical protein [Desulfoferrobacter suflitae]MCK8602854.1 hypothetical protein [Desulfoferrobacter suflitae]
MDETRLEEKLAFAFVEGWNITPTGNGFLLTSDWRWPNEEHIEIHVRAVGEREDLYLVSDGGDLFNFLFSHGIDLTRDSMALSRINDVVEMYESKFVDFQIARGANEEELARSVRLVLEAIKDASLILWHRFEAGKNLH